MEAILYTIALAVGILWFIDEILSFRNIEKYAIEYNKSPFVGWILHHHAKGLIYFKLTVYIAFVVLAAEVLRKYYLYFHILTLGIIALYFIFDIKIQRKLI